MRDTPVSLLLRMSDSPSEADWCRFVDLCTPLLYAWARRLGLSDSDSCDNVQDVMLILFRKLPEFKYDEQQSFHAWLNTIATNRVFERQRKKSVHFAASLSAVNPTAQAVTQFWELESRKLLVHQALKLMQENFEQNTWKACWEHTVNGRKAAEIADELGMTEGAVYVAKSRVLKRLREEFEGFLD